MTLRESFADATMKTMNLAHRSVLGLTGGRVLSDVFGMPAVSLETTGRKSGLPRRTMLTAPIIEDDRVVLVASKGGDDRDPDWFRNLVANPSVKLTVKGQTRSMRARVATPEEKSEMWPRVVAAYKGYAGYQRRTSRDIPLVICEPA